MREVLHIYIVEDEKIVALDIRNHLTSIGHNVIGISSSGEDCIEKLKTLKPDLVLMDINLAGTLTGIETAKIINETMNVPIVFLTAYTDDHTLKEVKRTGYYGYVTKPFKEIDLKTEIEFTIDRYNKLLKLKEDHDVSRTTLKETEEFFKQVVNNVSDIIYRIDLKGFFTYVNSSAIKQTGYQMEELMKMKYTSLIQNDYKQKAYFFFKNIFQNKVENSYFEFPLITKQGEEIWIGQKIHLLRSNNAIIGFQIIARDITQEKQFKEQLIIAKKNAENTANIKSQFLANMSHEIRTPLNGIIGLIHLLDKTELSEKQKTYVNAITTSSNQLMGIINDVLDLSKIEAGKVDIVEEEFDLHELIQSVISIFEMKSSEKDVELTYEIDSDVPQYVVGDSIHLNQIMYNLLGNAVKFTEAGEVKLKISMSEDEDDKQVIKFEVTDSGIGMADGVTDKIFDSFTQAESETTRKFGGTGLGLAIVKKLVELQGGTIDVKSKVGQGSSFTIQLKFTKAPAKKRNKLDMASQSEQFELLEGLKILLVEDNPINQLVTKDLLEEKGIQVTIAANGQIALDILKDEKFNIVLMDMQMPVLDGYQTMKIIRESEDLVLKKIPILALTANAIQTEVKKCYEFGANDYMSKPFKPDSLYSKILELIDPVTKENKMKTTDSFNEHVDLKTLDMFTNGKAELLQTTLEQLHISFKDDMGILMAAIDENESNKIKALAHKIKPNFLLIGMNKLGQLCKEIEHSEKKEELFEKVDKLVNAMPTVLDEIEVHTKRIHSSSV